MNAGKQALWFFTLLLTMAFSTLYYARTPTSHKMDLETLATFPDALVTDLAVNQFNEEGRLVQQLKAPRMRHIPKNNRHIFQSPDILLSHGKQPDWHITAHTATALDNGKRIVFKKEVLMHQPAGAHNEPSTVRTEALTYYPKQKLALSATRVYFEQPGTRMQAKGMRANLADKHLQLLSKTHVTYEPHHA